MLSQWIKCLDKRPSDRTDEDLEVIYKKLKSIKLFRRIHPSIVQQLCFVSYVEHIDKGVVLYREGDEALNWYAVIYGSLDVQVSNSTKRKDVVTLCTLGVGTAFGESGNHLDIDWKGSEGMDLWNHKSHLMQEIVANCYDSKAAQVPKTADEASRKSSLDNDTNNHNNSVDNYTNVSLVETNIADNKPLHRIGWTIRSVIMYSSPQLIRDRKYHLPSPTLYHRCLIGSELIDWILNITSNTPVRVHSRGQAAAMCQVLLEAKILNTVTTEVPTDENQSQFMDRYALYRFCFDDQIDPIMSAEDKRIAESELLQSLSTLAQLAPDAILRLILRKPPQKRTEEEIETVFEELLQINALSHLSNSVKKELAAVIAFESHPNKGTILFNQGDSGTCWYIILSGSVNVVIAGKGIVCTLHEGDDFGKLALAPRAATIVTNEANCQFLRVDKSHFDRILRDVEANTVRLKEHGKEVLILQKMASNQSNQSHTLETIASHYKYMVMAGTPEKMLEHLLETRLDTISLEEKSSDTLLQDFLLTFPVFISWKHLCNQLMRYYRIDELNTRQEKEFIIANKRRVVRFMHYWFTIAGEAFLKNKIVWSFIEDIVEALQKDIEKYKTFEDELLTLKTITEAKSIYDLEMDMRGIQKWKADNPGSVRRLSAVSELSTTNFSNDYRTKWLSIKANDEIICKVFCADHTYTTLKVNLDTKAEIIKVQAAEKLGMDKVEELVLVEVKSNGDRIPFRETEISIPTALTVNGRLFIAHVDHLDALTTLPEQDGPSHGTGQQLEEFSSQDLAYQLTVNGWQLFNNLHDYELIYHVFGRHNFNEITANLDVFLRHFNEIQFWTVTELVLEKSLSRRVQLLRRFIKIAGHCKDYQNLNAFFAIIMGLSNVAVARLSQTWERLPNKIKRTFSQYESLIDPSRNHRRYRIMVSKMNPSLIPFMPLLLKDITFAHEGNKTYIEQGLVNFEKMHMISQTLRHIRDCKSGAVNLEIPHNSSQKKPAFSLQLEQYIQEIKVIDCQRRLTQLSHALEHRKL